MAEVVDATKQEDGARMMGRYLLQAMQHAFGVVANDAIVDHVLRVQSSVPIAAILGQTVAEHHDGVGFHGRMGIKLGHALLVVRGGLEGFFLRLCATRGEQTDGSEQQTHALPCHFGDDVLNGCLHVNG